MVEKAAVMYHCEGSGHAMKMLAIAQQLEEQEIEVEITGGGKGEKFIELNGRDTFSPATIHYTSKYYDEGLLSSLNHLARDAPERIRDLRGWLVKQEPDFVVTDDPLVPFICMYDGIEYYVVSHWSWRMPKNRIEKAVTWAVNRISTLGASEFFYPSVWKGLKPDKAISVGPIAPNGEKRDIDLDILVVPTMMKDRTDEFIDDLRDYKLEVVGSESWEPQPSLQPYIEEATVVICGGYSTIMEASVAGTPCVIVPHTSEQRDIADILEEYEGYKRYSGNILEDVSQVGDLKPHKNGAEEIARYIVEEI